MPSLDDVMGPAPQVLDRLVESELLIVLPEQGRFLVLNDTGAQVWHLADGRRSLRDIAHELARTSPVDPHQAEADVLRLAGQLFERGALVSEPGP